MYTLYGDGIHDDYPAIQGMLDSGTSEVSLPAPEKNYLISKTLKIHGGQSLRLPPFAVIKLTDNANCAMIEDYDFALCKENIKIDGGIWDMNHNNQEPNPYHFPDKNGKIWYDYVKETGFDKTTSKVFAPLYSGHCMRFCNIRRLVIKNLTIKNPVVYGIQMAYIEDFDVSDIFFDYTEGSPKLWNMDGIHLEGGCKNGTVRNLKGACHDDLVAITTDDSLYGPIKNITVDGIFAEHCHSAVRLLSHNIPLENIKISNVYGSFYIYCIGLTNYYYKEGLRGKMKNIIIENVAASTCVGTKDVHGGNHPFIWVDREMDVEGLSISNVSREESFSKIPFIRIDKNSTVKRLRLSNLYQKSLLDEKITLLDNLGEITDMSEENIVNE